MLARYAYLTRTGRPKFPIFSAGPINPENGAADLEHDDEGRGEVRMSGVPGMETYRSEGAPAGAPTSPPFRTPAIAKDFRIGIHGKFTHGTVREIRSRSAEIPTQSARRKFLIGSSLVPPTANVTKLSPRRVRASGAPRRRSMAFCHRIVTIDSSTFPVVPS